MTIVHICVIEPESKVWTTILLTAEVCPTFFKMTADVSTISIALPGMTYGGNFMLRVLRGSSVIAPVAIDLMYMSAGGSIWTTSLSNTPA